MIVSWKRIMPEDWNAHISSEMEERGERIWSFINCSWIIICSFPSSFWKSQPSFQSLFRGPFVPTVQGIAGSPFRRLGVRDHDDHDLYATSTALFPRSTSSRHLLLFLPLLLPFWYSLSIFQYVSLISMVTERKSKKDRNKLFSLTV